MELGEFQTLMARQYGAKDQQRGLAATVAWLAEETGELAQAVRKGDRSDQIHELGDVIAWIASLANQLGIDLDQCIERFVAGCPSCGSSPCVC